MHKLFFYISFSFVVLCCSSAYGQTYTQMVDFADQKVVEGDYYYAIQYYRKAMNIDSAGIEINWKMAEVQRLYKDYIKAEYYYQKVFNKGSDPKSMVDISFRTEAEYNAKQAYYLKSASEVLTIKLVENLREGESGVYGVGARSYSSKYPKGVYNFSIAFPCGPENVENLKAAALEEVNKLLENGPTGKDVEKVKEAQRLELKEKMKTNRFWMSTLYQMLYYDVEFSKMLDMAEEIENLSAEKIHEAAKLYIGENRIITVLMPEE